MNEGVWGEEKKQAWPPSRETGTFGLGPGELKMPTGRPGGDEVGSWMEESRELRREAELKTRTEVPWARAGGDPGTRVCTKERPRTEPRGLHGDQTRGSTEACRPGGPVWRGRVTAGA